MIQKYFQLFKLIFLRGQVHLFLLQQELEELELVEQVELEQEEQVEPEQEEQVEQEQEELDQEELEEELEEEEELVKLTLK